MGSKEELVAEVKALQRSDPAIKQAWWDLCESDLGGVKDPNRHDEDILQNFLSQYGGQVEAAPAPAPRQRPRERAQDRGPRGAPPSRPNFQGGGGGGGGKGYPMMTMVPMQVPMQSNYRMPMASMGMGGAAPAGDLAGFIKLGQKSSASF